MVSQFDQSDSTTAEYNNRTFYTFLRHMNYVCQISRQSINTTGSTSTGHQQDRTDDVIKMSYMSVFIVIGLPLNIYAFKRICIRMHTHSSIRSRFRLLKLHLTMANLLMQFTAVGDIAWLGTFQWHGGDVLCKLFMVCHGVCNYLLSNVCVVIALDRALTIRGDHKVPAYRAHMRVKVMILLAWAVAAFCSIPQLFLWEEASYSGFKQCVSIWVSIRYNTMVEHCDSPINVKITIPNQLNSLNRSMIAYKIWHILAAFWIPCVIIASCYGVICHRLIKHYRSMRQRTNTDNTTHSIENITISDSRSNPDYFSTYVHRGLAPMLPLVAVSLDKQGQVNTKLSEVNEAERSRPAPQLARASTVSSRLHTRLSKRLLIRSRSEHNVQQAVMDAAAAEHNLVGDKVRRASTNTFIQTVIILSLYLVTWMPYNALRILDIVTMQMTMLQFSWLEQLPLLNAVINPLIYLSADEVPAFLRTRLQYFSQRSSQLKEAVRQASQHLRRNSRMPSMKRRKPWAKQQRFSCRNLSPAAVKQPRRSLQNDVIEEVKTPTHTTSSKDISEHGSRLSVVRHYRH